MSYSITITNSALSTDSVGIQVDSTSATAQTIAVGQSLTVTCDKVYYPGNSLLARTYSVSNLVNCTDEPYSPLVRRPYITPTADNASCTITVESGGPEPPEPPEPEQPHGRTQDYIYLDNNLVFTLEHNWDFSTTRLYASSNIYYYYDGNTIWFKEVDTTLATPTAQEMQQSSIYLDNINQTYLEWTTSHTLDIGTVAVLISCAYNPGPSCYFTSKQSGKQQGTLILNNATDNITFTIGGK